jgi:hypothetical protein
MAIGVACGGRTSGPESDAGGVGGSGNSAGGTGGTTVGGTTTGSGGGTTVGGTATGSGGGTTVGGTTTGTGGGTTSGGTTVGTTTGTGGMTVGGTGGTGTTGGSGGSGATGGGGIDAGVDWSACNGPGQCDLAPEQCCACGRLFLADLRAINSSKRAEFSKQVCSAMPTPCPPCVPYVDPHFMARCESRRCRGIDIRSDPTYTKCGSHQECRLRKGLACCECGATGEWVAVSHLGNMLIQADACASGSVCPGCVPVPPDLHHALCLNGVCTHVVESLSPAP